MWCNFISAIKDINKLKHFVITCTIIVLLIVFSTCLFDKEKTSVFEFILVLIELLFITFILTVIYFMCWFIFIKKINITKYVLCLLVFICLLFSFLWFLDYLESIDIINKIINYDTSLLLVGVKEHWLQTIVLLIILVNLIWFPINKLFISCFYYFRFFTKNKNLFENTRVDEIKALSDILNKKETSVLLCGKWGSGKTYFYKSLIKPRLQNYVIDVSCMHFNTLDELKIKLVQQKYQYVSIVFIFFEKIKNLITSTSSVLPKKCVIVIDDFERLVNNSTMNSTQLLNFICELKEVYKNSVLVLCNDDEFNNDNEGKNFSRYSEKIFDKKFSLPLPEFDKLYEQYSMNLPMHVNDRVKSILRYLYDKDNNVRVLRKTCEYIGERYYEKWSQVTQEAILNSNILIIVWSIFISDYKEVSYEDVFKNKYLKDFCNSDGYKVGACEIVISNFTELSLVNYITSYDVIRDDIYSICHRRDFITNEINNDIASLMNNIDDLNNGLKITLIRFIDIEQYKKAISGSLFLDILKTLFILDSRWFDSDEHKAHLNLIDKNNYGLLSSETKNMFSKAFSKIESRYKDLDNIKHNGFCVLYAKHMINELNKLDKQMQVFNANIVDNTLFDKGIKIIVASEDKAELNLFNSGMLELLLTLKTNLTSSVALTFFYTLALCQQPSLEYLKRVKDYLRDPNSIKYELYFEGLTGPLYKDVSFLHSIEKTTIDNVIRLIEFYYEFVAKCNNEKDEEVDNYVTEYFNNLCSYNKKIDEYNANKKE